MRYDDEKEDRAAEVARGVAKSLGRRTPKKGARADKANPEQADPPRRPGGPRTKA